MAAERTMHFYFNWAKERIDEMDAAVVSLEGKATQVMADSKVKAEQLIADLKKRRDEFEAQLKGYVETVGKQIEQQQATFREVAAAQVKAWREAADRLRDEGAKMATAKQADIDAAVKQMKADAAEADARLQKLKQAGSESWSAFSAALADSRKAFDRANQAAWNTLKRAGAPRS
jgi:hypothetical protein